MKKQRRIAVVIDLDWPYKHHQETFAGIQRFASERGDWRCIVDLYAETGLKGRKPRYDGVIARTGRELAAAARRTGVPLVNVWFNSPAKRFPAVFPDYEACGRLAADHLLARGLTRFGSIGFSKDLTHRVPMAAFEACVRTAGGTFSSRVVSNNYSRTATAWRAFNRKLESWIDTWQPPVGILSAFDLFARYLADASRRKGLSVPGDLAVVGIANESAICAAPPPAISSVDLNFHQVGYRAAELLERLIDGAEPPNGPVLVEPLGLVARQSTDSFAVDDRRVAEALRFMGEHGHEPIGVTEIAEGVHVTRRTLERAFRAALGRSIADELRRLRIERLKRQLVDSDASIKSLAVSSGFGSAEQMYKVFREAEGISPGAYRISRAAARGEP